MKTTLTKSKTKKTKLETSNVEGFEYFDTAGYTFEKQSILRNYIAGIDRRIRALKDRNAPMYWDILFDSISNPPLLERYAERYAKLNYFDWGNVDDRNLLRKRFGMLSDPMHKYYFPKEFIKVEENGEFYLDEEAVEKYCREKHTYIITPEQLKHVNNLIESLKGLGVFAHQLENCFITVDGEINPNWERLSKVIDGNVKGRTPIFTDGGHLYTPQTLERYRSKI